jgi:hypothetical protein
MSPRFLSPFALFRSLFDGLLLRIDFRDAHWQVSRGGANAWVVLAVVADQAAQLLNHQWHVYQLFVALVTLVLVKAPVRLAHALGGMYTGQALVSGTVCWSLVHLGVPQWVILCLLWPFAAWGAVAFGVAVARYVRTPKANFRQPGGAR